MEVKITLNGKMIKDTVDADMLLIDFCRKHKCYSVKRGCETGNCGLCTVLMDGKADAFVQYSCRQGRRKMR